MKQSPEMMHLEDQILCLCTRPSFTADHQQQVIKLSQSQPVDWQLVFDAAELHHVSPLVYHSLAQLNPEQIELSEAIRKQFKTAQIHNVMLKKGTHRTLKTVLEKFTQANIDVMLVKGTVLNLLVYDKPWYMISGDVDMVIKEASEESFKAGPHGQIAHDIDKINTYRNKFQQHIEFDFWSHHDMTMNGILKIDGEYLWQRAKKIEAFDNPVYVLPAEDLLLSAAINACRKRFFRLKALCDIASIIEHRPDLDWDYICQAAKLWQAHTILYTALIMTQRTLGCEFPAHVLRDLKISTVRRRIINRSVDRLLRHSLTSSAQWSSHHIFGRNYSQALLLTYTTYTPKLLLKKLMEIVVAWWDPPSPILPPVESNQTLPSPQRS